jgi:PAS domain-containing protein
MQRFPIDSYKQFSELPLEFFEEQRFNVYILDFNWNYLYVNTNVCKSLNYTKEELIGENMWEFFPKLAADVDFQLLRKNMEDRREYVLVTISPLTGNRLSIVGHPLEDCFYFTATVLPDTQNLVDELRSQLINRTKV